ncbi:MAG: transcriptional regulator, partial [Deltaproteobacteria bacterium]|nr:transcriptional regulator [Deltaproteobacteria bacterium]
QLFQKLRTANIVKSIRGPGGGFVLARHPSTISIWEVISSVEQNFSQIGCHRESKKVCNIIDGCKTQLM